MVDIVSDINREGVFFYNFQKKNLILILLNFTVIVFFYLGHALSLNSLWRTLEREREREIRRVLDVRKVGGGGAQLPRPDPSSPSS